MYAWIGRKCTKNEREQVWTTIDVSEEKREDDPSLSLIQKYLTGLKLSSRDVRVTKINEGMETALFKVTILPFISIIFSTGRSELASFNSLREYRYHQ